MPRNRTALTTTTHARIRNTTRKPNTTHKQKLRKHMLSVCSMLERLTLEWQRSGNSFLKPHLLHSDLPGEFGQCHRRAKWKVPSRYQDRKLDTNKMGYSHDGWLVFEKWRRYTSYENSYQRLDCKWIDDIQRTGIGKLKETIEEWRGWNRHNKCIEFPIDRGIAQHLQEHRWNRGAPTVFIQMRGS